MVKGAWVQHRSDRSERWRWETNSQFLDWWCRNRAGWAKKPDRRTRQQSPGKGAGAGFQARVCLPGSGEELLQPSSFPFRVASEHSQRRWVKPRRRQERPNGSNSGRTGPERRCHYRPPNWGVAPNVRQTNAGKLTGGTILEHEKRDGTVSGFPAESAGDELT